MKAKLIKALAILAFCSISIGIGITIAYIQDLETQFEAEQHQLQLSQRQIDHAYEAIDDLWLHHKVVSEVAEFWVNEYEDSQNRYSDLLANPIIKEVPVQIEVEVIREIEIIKEIEVPLPLEDWQSEEELRMFLEEHSGNITHKIIAGKDGEFQFSGQCVGLAMSWRDYAATYGKNLEMEFILPNEYREWFKIQNNNGHVILLAIVENYKLYYIEPTDLKIKYVGYVP